MTNEGWVEYDYDESLWMFLNSYGEWVIVDNVIWWLEPIEITAEEIDVMAAVHCGYTEDDIGNDGEMACLYEGFIAGAEAVSYTHLTLPTILLV